MATRRATTRPKYSRAAVRGTHRAVGDDDFLLAHMRTRGSASEVPAAANAPSFWDPTALLHGLAAASTNKGRPIERKLRLFIDESRQITVSRPSAIWGELAVLYKVLLGFGHPAEEITAFIHNALFDYGLMIVKTPPERCQQFAAAYRGWWEGVVTQQLQRRTSLPAAALHVIGGMSRPGYEHQEFTPADSLNDKGEGGISGWVGRAAEAVGDVATKMGGVKLEFPGGGITIGSETKTAQPPVQSQPALPLPTAAGEGFDVFQDAPNLDV